MSERFALAAERKARCATVEDGARLVLHDVIAAINDGDVPADLQEPLQSEANELYANVRGCPPDAPDRFRAFAQWVDERAED